MLLLFYDIGVVVHVTIFFQHSHSLQIGLDLSSEWVHSFESCLNTRARYIAARPQWECRELSLSVAFVLEWLLLFFLPVIGFLQNYFRQGMPMPILDIINVLFYLVSDTDWCLYISIKYVLSQIQSI